MTSASMMMVSYRKGFWDGNHLSLNTEWAIVDSTGKTQLTSLQAANFKEKRVLLLVHGFDTPESSVLPDYFKIQKQLIDRMQNPGTQVYDCVIGLVWPGCEKADGYYHAEEYTKELASRVRSDLEAISALASKVDVIAHSMGNRLMFEALKDSHSALIQRFFAFAPAVDNESVEKKEVYGPSVAKCERVYIFHSNRDEVLRFLYPLVDWDEALGYEGIEQPEKAATNIKCIDCSAVINGHSDYYDSERFFDAIRTVFLGPLVELFPSRELTILSDGKVVGGKS